MSETRIRELERQATNAHKQMQQIDTSARQQIERIRTKRDRAIWTLNREHGVYRRELCELLNVAWGTIDASLKNAEKNGKRK